MNHESECWCCYSHPWMREEWSKSGHAGWQEVKAYSLSHNSQQCWAIMGIWDCVYAKEGEQRFPPGVVKDQSVSDEPRVSFQMCSSNMVKKETRKCVLISSLDGFKIFNKVISSFHSSYILALPLCDSDVKMTVRQRAPLCSSHLYELTFTDGSTPAWVWPPWGRAKQKYNFSNALMRSWGRHCYIHSSRGEGQQVMITTALRPHTWPV